MSPTIVQPLGCIAVTDRAASICRHNRQTIALATCLPGWRYLPDCGDETLQRRDPGHQMCR
jgi:hypothetical protein